MNGMEDIVAVRVLTSKGEAAYFLTWGRIQDPVDPAPLEALVLRDAPSCGVEGVRAELCSSLQEAAAEPYFYESLFAMSQKPIPFGDGYEEWRASIDLAMQQGKELYFLGRRDRR